MWWFKKKPRTDAAQRLPPRPQFVPTCDTPTECRHAPTRTSIIRLGQRCELVQLLRR